MTFLSKNDYKCIAVESHNFFFLLSDVEDRRQWEYGGPYYIPGTLIQ